MTVTVCIIHGADAPTLRFPVTCPGLRVPPPDCVYRITAPAGDIPEKGPSRKRAGQAPFVVLRGESAVSA
ncbi:hypothetical protein GCM10012282_44730 [Streptomyces lacrimifluminis]|uniref:Uncharacterized protein n=1 Tax=Streptomyces lacrimifluminis TaxID=1500077 RepID=A0A917L3Q9_9ACTN|nr:hypothetical protein GCM10012282_44730 [Streptomyces lacrimifluminis]